MKKLDFYEFTGVLAPGVVAVFGVATLHPKIAAIWFMDKMDLGEFGVLLILAYVAGHLVQALGNIIENIWWKPWGGMPSDWVKDRSHNILAEKQWTILPGKIREVVKFECDDDLTKIPSEDWYSLKKQICVTVKRAGRTERVDIFNGNYGMFRGVAASLIVILAAALAHPALNRWKLYLLLMFLIALAIARMHRFGVHYARELFVELVAMQPGEKAEAKKEREE